MKKFFSLVAASVIAASTVNAFAQDHSYGDPTSVSYFSWYYVDDVPQALDVEFPNAAKLIANQNWEYVAIKQDGNLKTKGDISYITNNHFTCKFRDEIFPGTYTVDTKASFFTCYANEDDTEGFDTPAEAITMVFNIPGTETNPIQVSPEDGAVVRGPYMSPTPMSATWYELQNEHDGILTIYNNTEAYQTTVLVNGVQVYNSIPKGGNGAGAEVLVAAGDVVTIKAVSQESWRANGDYTFSYRDANAGETIDDPIALEEGDNLISFVASGGKFLTVPHYYTLTVQAGEKATVSFDDFVWCTLDNGEPTWATVDQTSEYEPTEITEYLFCVKNVANTTNMTNCNVTIEHGSTTAIQTLGNETKAVMIDLMGRRVSKANGVVILNGKKAFAL